MKPVCVAADSLRHRMRFCLPQLPWTPWVGGAASTVPGVGAAPPWGRSPGASWPVSSCWRSPSTATATRCRCERATATRAQTASWRCASTASTPRSTTPTTSTRVSGGGGGEGVQGAYVSRILYTELSSLRDYKMILKLSHKHLGKVSQILIWNYFFQDFVKTRDIAAV